MSSLVERTNYFARPGRQGDVLRIRRRASEVRVSLGLPAGTIFAKVEPGGDGPDVCWECSYPSEAAHAADMAARAASADFDAVRDEMRAVIARFERHVVRRVPAAEGAVAWAGDVDLEGLPIVPRELAFPSAGRELRGFLYLPPGDGPFPCVVTNHGSTLNRGTADLCRPSVAATLMGWGIASFLPHRAGYGGSPGPAWRDEVTGEYGTDAYDGQLAARLERESDDVVAALAFVRTLPGILPDRIGVMGSSFGGTVTLLAAAGDDRFRCAVEFAGAAMNWERAPRLRALMLDAARRLTRPIFFIQAGNDHSTAPTRELAAAAEAAGRTVRSRVFPPFGLSPEEGHLFERTGTMIWGPEVRRFLERWL